MYVIDYITPDRYGHIILAATAADAAKGMGKAFAEMRLPPKIAIKAGHFVSLYLTAKGEAAMLIQNVTLSPVYKKEFEEWTRDLFPSLQQ